MAIELTREERDAVRTEVLTALTEIGDFTSLVDAGQITKARRLSEKFHDCLTLLDDLGWDVEDERETFALTAPVQQLARVLWKLQHDVAGTLTSDILEARFNQRGMEGTALASAVFTRAVHEIDDARQDDAQDAPPAA